ncbi:hypothetical protein IAU60_002193 [Kwoniella sp. DSM 27419]
MEYLSPAASAFRPGVITAPPIREAYRGSEFRSSQGATLSSSKNEAKTDQGGILGRTLDANRLAADRLKALLSGLINNVEESEQCSKATDEVRSSLQRIATDETEGEVTMGEDPLLFGLDPRAASHPPPASVTRSQAKTANIKITDSSDMSSLNTEPSRKIVVNGHIISLDPDLPPMAIEHPARVWNTVIHGLPSKFQPVIKWDYEKFREDSNLDLTWRARLRLAVSPAHPIIARHPLFRTLPKNHQTKEYVGAVEALGGVRCWSGDVRRLKADAVNSTLVVALSDNALEWVRAPTLSMLPCDDKEDGEDRPVSRPMTADTAFANLDPPVHIPSDEIANDEAVLTSGSADEPLNDCQLASIPHLTDENQNQGSPLKTLEDAFQRTLGARGLNLQGEALSISAAFEPASSGYVCQLHIGPVHYRISYQSVTPSCSLGTAIDAVCRTALNGDVVGYMEWLSGSLRSQARIVSDSNKGPTAKRIIVKPPLGVLQELRPKPAGPLSDAHELQGAQMSGSDRQFWRDRLAVFCQGEGHGLPRFSEQVYVYEEDPVLLSQLAIDGKTYWVTKDERSTDEVQEYLAKKVLKDLHGESVGQLGS